MRRGRKPNVERILPPVGLSCGDAVLYWKGIGGADDMEKQSMGELICARRKERGMTQKELALQMHVTDKAVSKWERDRSCPMDCSWPGSSVYGDSPGKEP